MNDGKLTEVEEMNLRVKMTRTLWFLATGMMGICIPLADETHSGPLVPFAVLIAVTLATRAIWGRDGAKSLSSVASALPVRNAPISTPSRVQELEERLANLEAITSFENKLLNKKFPDAAPVSAAPAYTFETPAREADGRPTAPPMPVDSGGSEEMRRGAARPVAS